MNTSPTMENLIPLPTTPKTYRAYSKRELGTQFLSQHRGPTATSNWLLPNRYLMSAYPGDPSEEKARLKVKLLLGAGIRTFVCLQETNELKRFKPYRHLVTEEFQKLSPDEQNQYGNIEFVHFPIPDNSVTSHDDVDKFTDELVDRYNKNENILVHCWGGHGRTGTISAVFMCKLYCLDATTALARTRMTHDCRDEARSSAPQHPIQFRQVIKLCNQAAIKRGEPHKVV
jgi:protein-tyrosine phosphatase